MGANGVFSACVKTEMMDEEDEEAVTPAPTLTSVPNHPGIRVKCAGKEKKRSKASRREQERHQIMRVAYTKYVSLHISSFRPKHSLRHKLARFVPLQTRLAKKTVLRLAMWYIRHMTADLNDDVVEMRRLEAELGEVIYVFATKCR